jgi:hypothetical protein
MMMYCPRSETKKKKMEATAEKLQNLQVVNFAGPNAILESRLYADANLEIRT